MVSVSFKSFELFMVDNFDFRLMKFLSGQRVVIDGFDVFNFIDFKWDVVFIVEFGGYFFVLFKIC